MIHMRMRGKLLANMNKGPMFVAHQMSTFINELINNGLQRDYLFIFNRNSPHGALALNGYEYSLFARAFSAFVHDTWLGLWITTHICFIKLHNTLKQSGIRVFRVHHLPDNMAHTPSRWLSDT